MLSGERLNLTILSGSYYNWLLRDNTTAAAILLNKPDYNRTALGPGFRWGPSVHPYEGMYSIQCGAWPVIRGLVLH